MGVVVVPGAWCRSVVGCWRLVSEAGVAVLVGGGAVVAVLVGWRWTCGGGPGGR